MKKQNWKMYVLVGLVVVLMSMGISGCGVGKYDIRKTDKSVMGSFLLSVNPEIEVQFDDEGRVVRMTGMNEDGQTVLEKYGSYGQEDCVSVLDKLIRLIAEQGYFAKTIGGNDRNIIIKIQGEAEYPSEGFTMKLAKAASEAAKAEGVQTEVVLVEKRDLNEEGVIGAVKAQELALAQLNRRDAEIVQCKYDQEEGTYEIMVAAGGEIYKMEVNDVNGKVMEIELDTMDLKNEMDDSDDEADDDVEDTDDTDDSDCADEVDDDTDDDVEEDDSDDAIDDFDDDVEEDDSDGGIDDVEDDDVEDDDSDDAIDDNDCADEEDDDETDEEDDDEVDEAEDDDAEDIEGDTDMKNFDDKAIGGEKSEKVSAEEEDDFDDNDNVSEADDELGDDDSDDDFEDEEDENDDDD